MSDRELVERAMDDYVVGDAWPPGAEEVPVPRDVEAASGILRRLKSLDRERAQINGVVDAEIRRLELFRSDSVAGIEQEIVRGRAALDPFMRAWGEASHKKTLALPDGKLTLRGPGAGKIVVEDEAALIAWATAQNLVSSDPEAPSVVNLKPVVSKAEIGKATHDSAAPIAVTLDDDGAEVEVYALYLGEAEDAPPVPGVTRAVAANDKFDVTIGED